MNMKIVETDKPITKCEDCKIKLTVTVHLSIKGGHKWGVGCEECKKVYISKK